MLFASGDDGAKPDGSHLCTHFPASDPNVLSVGGTDLVLTGCGTNACSGYGSEDAWSGSGGGYTGAFPEPSWQVSTIGPKSGRALPDVAMLGGTPGVWAYHSLTNCGSTCGWFGVTGTSLATPLWAGLLAVALQVRGGGGFGNIDPLLYQLASSPSYSTTFHDIQSGSNGYVAVQGWDAVTGWGSPIANTLAAAFAQQQVTTDRSTYSQGDTIHYTGSAFTALGSIQACVSIDNDGTRICVGEPNADSNGNVAGSMLVGSNIPAGPQKFIVEDVSTSRFSNSVQLTILALTQTLTTGVDSGSGSVSPNCPSGCSEAVGSSQTITATPTTGWKFSSWSTQSGISCSSNPCIFNMPNNAVTLKATFIVQLSVGLVSPPSPVNGGSVAYSPVTLEAQVTGGGPVLGAGVNIYVNGTKVCSGSSDVNGIYSCSYSLPQGMRVYVWYAAASKSGYADGLSSTFTFTFTPPSLSSAGSAMLSGSENSVYFIFPDSNIAHKKPTGVGYAQVTDWTALGFTYGSLTNMPQVIALDTNSAYIDQSTGAPKVSNKMIVLFGGPLVNEVVHYYESNGIAPLHWALVGGWVSGTEYYENRLGQPVASIPLSVLEP